MHAPVKSLTKLPDAETAVELGFGPHLVFDGHRCPAARLSDLDRLYALLDRLPDQIGMTKIMPPYVFRHGPAGPAAGLSGFVLIAESHISVHTFPALGFVNADVFSCEPFDPAVVLSALKRAFTPGRVEWKLFDRGREFPKNIGQSRATVLRDRWDVARNLGLEVSR
ncbi:MAG TPA: S-adenosylmethionine decarboxylase [Candidatus Eisenbacteria bacterium]